MIDEVNKGTLISASAPLYDVQWAFRMRKRMFQLDIGTRQSKLEKREAFRNFLKSAL